MSSEFLDQPEGKTLEFKRDLSSPKPLLKTLVAFANCAGGRLIIEINESAMRLRITVPLVEQIPVSTGDASLDRRAQSGAQSGAQSDAILRILALEPHSANELVQLLGLRSKTGSFKRALNELLEQGKIERTIPDKPNSRLQKYQLPPS